ncbi:hypothetical protein KSS87_000081 [Heliosperma pusillum]|nr:hypothetical protein KSS87_000081 [Heliosperma pusillum]
MKFLSWMQNKINGRPGNRKPSSAPLNHLPKQPLQREEFNDWPQGFLTIGTFGNDTLNEQPRISEIQTAVNQEQEQDPTCASSQEFSEFTPEEIALLQTELTKLLKRKPAKEEEENTDLPLDRFLNCPSNLEVSRRISNARVCTDPEYKEDEFERTISVIIDKCKEVRAEKTKNAIGKKSLSFLIKKMFVCASGFSPAPSLRDTLPETRMEKLLRTIVHKKMRPKTNSSTSSVKRYLEDGHNSENRNDEDETEQRPKSSEACKWDKTDSDFIVLEI